MLRSGDSVRMLTEIEAAVEDYYPPACRSVDRRGEWTGDLETRSRSIFVANYDAHTPPSDKWGRWRPLR